MATAAAKLIPTLIGALVALFSYMIFTGSGFSATDFKVLWGAVNSPIPYAPADWPFAYPPTMLLWLQPLRLAPLWPAFIAWSLLGAGLYVAAVRPLVGKWWPYALLAYPGAFCLCTGQVSLFVAALIFLAFQTRHRGLLLGLAFTIKPQLVFLAPLVLDRNQLAWFAGTVLALCLAATAVFGIHIWHDWFASFGHFAERAQSIGVLRAAASPAALASYYDVSPIPFLLAGLALGTFTLLRSEPSGPLLAACCIVSSPYALTYDLVAVMPLAIPHLISLTWWTLPAAMAATSLWETIGVVGLAARELGIRDRKASIGIVSRHPVGDANLPHISVEIADHVERAAHD